MPSLPVRDLELYYEEHGQPDGEPLLLLHGFTGTGRRAWGHLLDRLGERHRLIVPDWRGHGRTTNPSGTIVHRQLAEDMAAFAEAIGLSRAHWCGTSSGGMQLLFLASQRPDLVHSLTLCAATYTFDEHCKAAVRQRAASVAPERIAQLRADHGPTHGPDYWRTLIDHWAASVERPDEMPFAPESLARIGCPTLVVHGDRDIFFPVRIPVAMYQAIPNAELAILPRCGHGVPSERPEPFAAALLDFLSRSRLPG